MKTEILVILDESGSMGVVKLDTIGALNNFIESQKREPGECYLTLVKFNSLYNVVYEGKKLQEVQPLTAKDYIPREFTALLDAVGNTIVSQGERFKKNSPEKVICVILTDGMENASRKFDRKQVFDLIKQQQDQWKWEFTYLGANVDAFAEAQKLGIKADQAINFSHDKAGLGGVICALNNKVSSERKGMAYAYSDDDRAKSQSK